VVIIFIKAHIANNKKSREALKGVSAERRKEIGEGKDGTDEKEQRKAISKNDHYKEQDSIDRIKFNASHLIADWFNGWLC
jgi:hypothetical protein